MDKIIGYNDWRTYYQIGMNSYNKAMQLERWDAVPTMNTNTQIGKAYNAGWNMAKRIASGYYIVAEEN